MSEFMESLASSTANVASNYYVQHQLDEQNNKRYQENQTINYQRALESAKLAPSLEVSGMKNAGLSPALAQDGKFSSVATASAPLNHSSAPQGSIDFVQASQVASNVRLQDAQAEKLKAEAQSIQMQNKKTADDLQATHNGVYESLTQIVDSESPYISSELRSSAQVLLDTMDLFPNVTPETITRTLRIGADLRDISYNELAKENERYVEYEFRRLGILEDKAKMPSAQRDLITEQVSKAIAEIQLISDNDAVSKKQLEHLEASIKLLGAQASKENVQAELLRHSDFTGVIKEYQKGKMSDTELGARLLFAVLSMFGAR